MRLLRRGAAPSTDTDAFDAEFGIDTAKIREIGTLDLDAQSARHAVRYQASPADLVRGAIESLNVDPSDMVFVDFGSGKGRVLIIAASFAFKAVVGVELSRELHQIALDNIRRLPRSADRERISLNCCNVLDFELPTSNLVCYLYNPFGPAVLEPLLERLRTHAERHGRRLFIIYMDPRHRAIFDKLGAFTTIVDTPQLLVVRA